MSIKRPVLTKEIVLCAVKDICKNLDIQPEHIADCYRHHMDGYELARELDRDYGYDFSMDDLYELDSISSAVDGCMVDVEKAWEKENNIQPPFPIGTKITKGVITGIDKYGAARYFVKEDGCTMDGRSLIVRFEDAEAVNQPPNAEER